MQVKINNIRIQAISSYLPYKEIKCKNIKSVNAEEIENIIKVTGVESFHVANEIETSSDMCYYATMELLNNNVIDKTKIDGLIFVSQTNDYILPSTSVILQNRIGLSKDTVCIDIHYGCSGYIYGVLQASLWISSGLCNNVLVLSGDTTSKMINEKDRSLKMVFGDAGTATLINRSDSEMCFSIHSDGSGYDKLIIPAGGFRLPCSDETKIQNMDEDGNIRSQENLYMDGMGIFSFAITNVPNNINEVLLLQQWEKDEVGLFVLHQANRFMIERIAKKLKIQKQQVPINLNHVGNTGPATIPLLLSELGDDLNVEKLKKVVMSGFGVGLSWGSLTCDLTRTKFYKPINK